ncbi:hypothetical protein RhiirA5_496139 [Rhizophagus irregularis]|uniref:Uncharacterized protein n=1 Tax=Rhizophagus irregularis TaxID=588596 RepID=A0A2N0Q2Y2_9GLOM|nr:hypothetical protein RhiirA5_496139 [Rhizophagus irregularis]CAB5183084.1 unnamed protein product [Rhizophagus irregularis]
MNKFNRNTSIKIFKNLSSSFNIIINITNNNINNKYFFHSYTKTNSSLYNLSRFKNGNNKNINNNNILQININNSNKPYLIFEQQKRWHINHHHHGHRNEEHSGLIAALTISDSKSRGTKITLWGLASNVGLTAAKGVAGVVMNSASLVADAAHSLSDLISDFVTLYTFRKSRRPADATHPYGYGKYESIGSLAVSSLLIAGAIGIGHHSYELLVELLPVEIPTNISELNGAINSANLHPLNPNAAWFAAASVLVKEILFRITLKIGLEERSDVLIANAWHHRSDAASSLVALGAIVGSYLGFPFLDPVGGILVAGMIMKSGFEIMLSSLKELADMKVEEDIICQVEKAVEKSKGTNSNIVNFHSIRGRKSGPFHLIDMVLQVDPDITVSKAHHIEEQVRRAVKDECKSVKEVLMHLDVEDQQPHH